MYELTNQIQRAAVSIRANIADGCGKDSEAELKRYFLISMRSSSELEYLLLLAQDLGYLSQNIFRSMNDKLVEIRKMLNAFIQKPKSTR
jgi:four helix bundle protein